MFHLGDYRRESIGSGQDIPEDYFFVNGMQRSKDYLRPRLYSCDHFLASASSVLLRQKILKKCREDIYQFLNNENGQVAIYDAVNPLAAGRRSLAKEFAKQDIEVSVVAGSTRARLTAFCARLSSLSQLVRTRESSRRMCEASRFHHLMYCLLC